MSEKMKVRVLIVDDEAVVRDFLVRLLNLRGVEAKAVDSGSEAVTLAQEEKFDLFLLDVRMPGKDGLQTLNELKTIQPKAKYVMMTGYAVDEMLKECERQGAVYSIKKPFKIDEIVDIVEASALEKIPSRQLKVLVVDDEDVVLNFFKRLLHKCEVFTAKTAEAALGTLRENDIDMAFLDIVLKGMNGRELAREMLKARPDLEIILITGDPGKGAMEKDLPVRGCLWKPFEIDKILSEVDTVKRVRGL